MISGALVCLLALLSPGASPPQATADRVEQLRTRASEASGRGDLAGAAAAYEQLISVDPSLAPAYNNLGSIYLRQREFQKAADILEKGLRVDPRMKSAVAMLGTALFELGRYQDARVRLEEALQVNPSDSNLELVLANDLTKVGDFEAAAEHFQRLSVRLPKNQHVLYLLAKVYMQLGQQALARMNAIDPDSVWVHEISAEVMDGMKNYDGATVEYKKAIEIAPRQPGVHFKLGDLYWSLSQWDNAAAEFRAELVNDPKNCMAQWKLGDILVQQSIRPEEALADIDKALTMCPELNEARMDRGKVLLQLRRAQDALPDLEAAVKQAPEDAAGHFLLARAYRALGRQGDAEAEMKTFTALEEKTRSATTERALEIIKNKESH